jgi:hypothetical protein
MKTTDRSKGNCQKWTLKSFNPVKPSASINRSICHYWTIIKTDKTGLLELSQSQPEKTTTSSFNATKYLAMDHLKGAVPLAFALDLAMQAIEPADSPARHMVVPGLDSSPSSIAILSEQKLLVLDAVAVEAHDGTASGVHDEDQYADQDDEFEPKGCEGLALSGDLGGSEALFWVELKGGVDFWLGGGVDLDVGLVVVVLVDGVAVLGHRVGVQGWRKEHLCLIWWISRLGREVDWRIGFVEEQEAIVLEGCEGSVLSARSVAECDDRSLLTIIWSTLVRWYATGERREPKEKKVSVNLLSFTPDGALDRSKGSPSSGFHWLRLPRYVNNHQDKGFKLKKQTRRTPTLEDQLLQATRPFGQ